MLDNDLLSKISKCFDVLGSKRRLEIWLIIHSGKHVSLTDISNETGMLLVNVSKAIKELEDAGLVLTIKVGRKKYPKPNLSLTQSIGEYFNTLYMIGNGNETE